MGWKKLGAGTYNTAYISADAQHVFKVSKSKAATDLPDRSVRLWNAINPHLPAEVMTDPKLGEGWRCPYVQGRQANDKEMPNALIDIFNKTGRIIVDATATKNFITTQDGRVVCIDIGMALQMEKREDACFDAAARRKSVVSLDTWINLEHGYNTQFFKQNAAVYPNTINMTKALLFIKSYRPDVFDVDFLKKNTSLVKTLAKAYDNPSDINFMISAGAKLNKVAVRHGTNLLMKERPLDLDNIKESCVRQLEQYIQSRGTVKEDKEFKHSIRTYFLRKTDTVTHKVTQSQAAIEKIKQAQSLDEIDHIIKDSQKDTRLMQSGFLFSSNIASRLGSCLLIVETAKKSGLNFDKAPTAQVENKLQC